LQVIEPIAGCGPIVTGYTSGVSRPVTIGQNAARIRKAKKIRQGELAARLGWAQGAVSRFEHSEGWPETSTLLKVAAALECPIEDLVAGVLSTYDQSRVRERNRVTKPNEGKSLGRSSTTGVEQGFSGEPVLSGRPNAHAATLSSTAGDIAGRLSTIAAALHELSVAVTRLGGSTPGASPHTTGTGATRAHVHDDRDAPRRDESRVAAGRGRVPRRALK
jgi:transcriptional regulator with XRE-family HTH domain